MTKSKRMIDAINNDAVFAQLDLRTTGTTYDESVELFRVNSEGKKVGKWNIELDFDILVSIATYMMAVRKNSNLSKEECGKYDGFTIKIIYEGGAQSHFDVNYCGVTSDELEGWTGTTPFNQIA